MPLDVHVDERKNKSIDFDFYRRQADRYRRRIMRVLMRSLARTLFDIGFKFSYGFYSKTWRSVKIRKRRRQLRELPNHVLRDIGIYRGEIDSITLFDTEFDLTPRPRSEINLG